MHVGVDFNKKCVYALHRAGLERVAVLNKDIEWMAAKGGLAVPSVGPAGAAYAAAIKDVASDTPRFINHYYNHYFGKKYFD